MIHTSKKKKKFLRYINSKYNDVIIFLVYFEWVYNKKKSFLFIIDIYLINIFSVCYYYCY